MCTKFSPELQQAQKIMSSPEIQQAQKIIHLTSAQSLEVANKIAKISRQIFEQNREAYRMLANK